MGTEEFDMEYEEQTRECGNHCSHYDNINSCCWQSGDWGLCFNVQEGDLCKLRYKEAEF